MAPGYNKSFFIFFIFFFFIFHFFSFFNFVINHFSLRELDKFKFESGAIIRDGDRKRMAQFFLK